MDGRTLEFSNEQEAIYELAEDEYTRLTKLDATNESQVVHVCESGRLIL